jgi:hypothetical protein
MLPKVPVPLVLKEMATAAGNPVGFGFPKASFAFRYAVTERPVRIEEADSVIVLWGAE